MRKGVKTRVSWLVRQGSSCWRLVRTMPNEAIGLLKRILYHWEDLHPISVRGVAVKTPTGWNVSMDETKCYPVSPGKMYKVVHIGNLTDSQITTIDGGSTRIKMKAGLEWHGDNGEIIPPLPNQKIAPPYAKKLCCELTGAYLYQFDPDNEDNWKHNSVEIKAFQWEFRYNGTWNFCIKMWKNRKDLLFLFGAVSAGLGISILDIWKWISDRID